MLEIILETLIQAWNCFIRDYDVPFSSIDIAELKGVAQNQTADKDLNLSDPYVGTSNTSMLRNSGVTIEEISEVDEQVFFNYLREHVDNPNLKAICEKENRKKFPSWNFDKPQDSAAVGRSFEGKGQIFNVEQGRKSVANKMAFRDTCGIQKQDMTLRRKYDTEFQKPQDSVEVGCKREEKENDERFKIEEDRRKMMRNKMTFGDTCNIKKYDMTRGTKYNTTFEKPQDSADEVGCRIEEIDKDEIFNLEQDIRKMATNKMAVIEDTSNIRNQEFASVAEAVEMNEDPIKLIVEEMLLNITDFVPIIESRNIEMVVLTRKTETYYEPKHSVVENWFQQNNLCDTCDLKKVVESSGKKTELEFKCESSANLFEMIGKNIERSSSNAQDSFRWGASGLWQTPDSSKHEYKPILGPNKVKHEGKSKACDKGSYRNSSSILGYAHKRSFASSVENGDNKICMYEENDYQDFVKYNSTGLTDENDKADNGNKVRDSQLQENQNENCFSPESSQNGVPKVVETRGNEESLVKDNAQSMQNKYKMGDNLITSFSDKTPSTDDTSQEWPNANIDSKNTQNALSGTSSEEDLVQWFDASATFHGSVVNNPSPKTKLILQDKDTLHVTDTSPNFDKVSKSIKKTEKNAIEKNKNQFYIAELLISENKHSESSNNEYKQKDEKPNGIDGINASRYEESQCEKTSDLEQSKETKTGNTPILLHQNEELKLIKKTRSINVRHPSIKSEMSNNQSALVDKTNQTAQKEVNTERAIFKTFATNNSILPNTNYLTPFKPVNDLSHYSVTPTTSDHVVPKSSSDHSVRLQKSKIRCHIMKQLMSESKKELKQKNQRYKERQKQTHLRIRTSTLHQEERHSGRKDENILPTSTSCDKGKSSKIPLKPPTSEARRIESSIGYKPLEHFMTLEEFEEWENPDKPVLKLESKKIKEYSSQSQSSGNPNMVVIFGNCPDCVETRPSTKNNNGVKEIELNHKMFYKDRNYRARSRSAERFCSKRWNILKKKMARPKRNVKFEGMHSIFVYDPSESVIDNFHKIAGQESKKSRKEKDTKSSNNETTKPRETSKHPGTTEIAIGALDKGTKKAEEHTNLGFEDVPLFDCLPDFELPSPFSNDVTYADDEQLLPQGKSLMSSSFTSLPMRLSELSRHAESNMKRWVTSHLLSRKRMSFKKMKAAMRK